MKKKKVIITSFAVAFSMSVGTAWAANNSGVALSSWYNKKFNESIEQLNKNVVEPEEEKITNDLGNFTDKLIRKSTRRIKEVKEDTILNSRSSILLYNDDYITQINSAENKINKQMPKDFNKFIREKNLLIDKAIDDETKDYLTELNNELDEVLVNTSKVIESSSKDNQEQLKNAIEDSKKEIHDEIKLNEQNAENKVKENLDKKIEEVRKDIEKNSQEYADEKIKSIEEKSNELEKEAQQEMLNIIFNIRNN